MPSRYHPIYDGLWDDDSLEGAPFILKGFFAFLCSNRRLRPSGIYRASDAQLAADTSLSVAQVRAYLTDLVQRQRIVRDGAWIFVRGYFARQPKQAILLSGVQTDVSGCGSIPILQAFAEKYPVYGRWSADRQAMVAHPTNGVRPTEQSSTEQSRADTTMAKVAFDLSALSPADRQFLEQTPEPYRHQWCATPDWWISLKDGYPGVNLQREASRYMAWRDSQPDARRHKNTKTGLRHWVAKAARWLEQDAMRKAVRR